MSNREQPTDAESSAASGAPVSISGAIMAAPVAGDINRNEPQPRQPQSLHGLLRFAMETTKCEDAPSDSQFGPLDAERKKFLEEAIKSMTVDVIETINKNLQILLNADSIPADCDITEHLNAFENILEYVDRIDTAIDFHKIGGFMIFKPSFNCVHAPIRASACNLLAELCQNNPYCQAVVTDNELMLHIFSLLDKDPDENVQIKALYAISCNVRGNTKGYDQFLNKGGVQSVFNALQRPADKLRTKASFLLTSLCHIPQFKELLINLEIIPLLITLISEDRMSSHEHILSLLHELVADNFETQTLCTDPKYDFKHILNHHLKQTAGKPEFDEETQYCRDLLSMVFKGEEMDR